MRECTHCGFMKGKNSTMKENICPECDFLLESQMRKHPLFVEAL